VTERGSLLVDCGRESERTVAVSVGKARNSVRAHAVRERQLLGLVLDAVDRLSAVKQEVVARMVGGLERGGVGISAARRDLDLDVVTRAGDLRVGVAGYSVRAHADCERNELLADISLRGRPIGRAGRMIEPVVHGDASQQGHKGDGGERVFARGLDFISWLS
jgi:hypothetical protein